MMARLQQLRKAMAGQGAPVPGSKYKSRRWNAAAGRWDYDYGDGKGHRAKDHDGPDEAPEKAPEPVQASEHDWSSALGPLTGKALVKSLGAAPGRGARMVLALVDQKHLEDLEGDDDDARLADLHRKAPAVVKALRDQLALARTSPLEVKQRLLWLMGRQGWSGQGRAELLGELLGPHGRLVAENFAMLAVGAENLAGGAPVSPVHVASAVALRNMGGDWPKEIATVAVGAQREAARLVGLLELARQKPSEASTVLQQMMSSDLMQKMAGLAKAWPGLVDKDRKEVLDTLLEVPSAAPRWQVTGFGSHCALYVPGEHGQPRSVQARYKLVEASDLVCSHDPDTFSANGLYPEGLQERRYHTDKAEQAKVIRNADNLKPDFLINTNPDGVNGPPVVTRGNIALGGNSRGMSTQLAYRKGKGAGYKAHLTDRAHHFGFKPEDVQAMVSPVLVREVDADDDQAFAMVRQLNESQTQAMDPRTLAVAQARKLSPSTLGMLASGMREDESLADFFSSGRSSDFVAALSADGLIDDRNANAYKSGGMLTKDGRTMVERVLVGHLLGDADLLVRLPERSVSALARSVPYLVQARSHGATYDLSEPLRLAADAYARVREQSKAGGVSMPDSGSDKASYDAAMDRLRRDMFGDAHQVFSDPRAESLLEVMIRRPGERQMSQVFSAFASAASKNPENQASLFGSNDPKEAADRAMQTFHDSITRGINAQAYAELMAKQQEQRLAASKEEKKKQAGQQAGADSSSGQGADKPEVDPNQNSLFLSMHRLWTLRRQAQGGHHVQA